MTSGKRVYFSVFGSGLGHVTRTKEIASSLRQISDISYIYSTFDEAYDYLVEHNEPVVKSPSVDLEWNKAGGFSARDSFLHAPVIIMDFARQVSFEARNITRFKPEVVVSDTRLSAVLAAATNSFPIITILNQFKILFPPRFRAVAVSSYYERIAGDFLGLLWSLSDEVLMPDLPPPYTIGEANVAGTDVSDKVQYVGFMTPRISVPASRLEDTRRKLKIDDRPLVFLQISGPRATKKRFVETSISAADELSRQYNVVISTGDPLGSDSPRRLSNDAWLYEWCPVKDELFVLCDVLVARSGHTTIGQCIELGKPAVLVPIYNHSEQLANAHKFQKLGLGLEIRSESLSAQLLAEYIGKCFKETSFKSNVERLKRVAEEYHGVETAARTVDRFL